MDFFDSIHKQIAQFKESTAVIHHQLTQPLPVHQHPVDQFILVTKGLAYLITESNSYYVPARHYIWIPRNIPHKISFLQGELRLKTIYYSQTDPSDFYARIGIYPLQNLLHSMLDFTQSWNGIFVNDWRQRFLVSIRDILQQVPHEPVHLYLPVSENTRIKEVVAYLKAHLDGDVSVPTIAKEMGFSVRNFTRFFTKEMGMPYVKYVKTYKILCALEIMMHKRVSISEICYQVGYSSITNFSNNFYELLGKRPKAFILEHNPTVSV